jgi:hypothetical protein
MSNQKLGTTFHRTFPLVRSAVAQVLALALDNDLASDEIRRLDYKTIRQETQLGTRYVEAMPRYAMGCGLLDARKRLTTFGKAAAQGDAQLDHEDTSWLMHYHLSAPHGPGPEFWYNAVRLYFRSDYEFSRSNVVELIGTSYLEATGKPLAIDSANTTAGIFKGAYIKEEGLGKLGILEEVSLDQYRVLSPVPPSPWVVGYALLDYWQAQFGDRLTVNLDALSGNGSLADLFLMGAERLDGMLRVLQTEGYVDVYRVAPPYQVVLLRQDPIPLLEKIYGSHNLA